LNIIEYLFCERLFGQVLLIEKSVAGKVRQRKVQKKCGRKSADRKSVAEKVWQKKCGRKMCGRKSAAEKSRQKKCGRKMRQKNAAEKVWQKKCGRKIRKIGNNMVGVYL
jgi:hypothetical protein